jgi:PAT family beta-lactamase induction signal transducer AmpG
MKKTNRWTWIPSLYFAEGLPFVAAMTVSVIMYKRLDISNTDIALYTSWLYLPWVIKPFWSPLVDVLKTKRAWIVAMQLLVGAGLAAVALTIPADNFFRYSLAVLWLIAFSSATHDIAADGFYMLALSKHDQAWFVGVRSTFFRLAMITGQGLLVVVAGYFEGTTGDVAHAWSKTFAILAALFFLLCVYHWFFLPRPDSDRSESHSSLGEVFEGFYETIESFFRKKDIGVAILFLLLFRFSEAQLAKLAAPFLLDEKSQGGLGLGTTEIGIAYGTTGIAMLTFGGLLGGFLAARHGLKYWLWWMVAAINLPNAVYIVLAYALPENFLLVNIAVGIEQFGYGFGFTAYMLYMIYVAEGDHKTAHFALCTGFMALGMMLPGMFSGWLQEALGYQQFFVWIMIATIPSFIVTGMINVDPGFGRKE